MIRLALYQPDIPQNAGSLMRLGACLDLPLDIIEPCGFLWDERRMRRAGMDYLDRVAIFRHASWEAFQAAKGQGRLVLLSTKGDDRLDCFAFQEGDIIMVGREGAGVPDEVAAVADKTVRLPMAAGMRSLNVAMAAAMAVGVALGQLGGWPASDAGKT